MRRKHRRKHRRNAWFGASRRHRKAALKGRRHRRHNPRRRRHLRHRRNPAFSGVMKTATAGFNVDALEKAGLVVAGIAANAYGSSLLTGLMPIDMLRTKPGYYVPGLVSAGAVGALAGMVAPRFAAPIFSGAMAQVVLKAVSDYLPSVKMLGRALGDFFTTRTMTRPLAGMRDFQTVASPMVGLAGDIMQEAAYGDLF